MKHFTFYILVFSMSFCSYAQSTNITQIEYFLDSDNGFGQNTVLDVVAPDIDVTETILANILNTSLLGYHKLFFRTKDANGNWSHTVKKHIEVVAPNSHNNVVMGEYFIDEDFQFGTGTSFAINPEEEDIEQAFSAQILASTPLGFHKLYGRVKDSKGNWSHTFRKNIQVYMDPITNVIEIEYFFIDDHDLGFGSNYFVAVDGPEVDGTWNFNVPYPSGSYNFDDVLFIRVKDSDNRWSITTILDDIGTLNANDYLLNNVSIAPNPFNREVNIFNSESVKLKGVEVYDLIGKKVFSSDSGLRMLNLERLESGTYILMLITDNGKANFKIIKQ